MNSTPKLILVTVFLLACAAFISPAFGQSKTGYVAGINYPAGPATMPTNTGYYIGGIQPVEIHYGDFNDDGKTDIVVAASCEAVYFPACTSGYSAAVVYLGNGDGTFGAPILSGPSLPPEIRALTVGDFDGDGKLDVAVAADCLSSSDCSAGTVTILLGNGDGTFTQKSQYPINGVVGQAGTLAVGKFSTSGKLDLAVGIECYNIPVNGCSVGSVSIFPGNGDGTLGTPTSYATVGNSPLFPVVADFTNDGKLDVIAGSAYSSAGTSQSSLTILKGNGDGTFSKSSVNLPFYPIMFLAAGDLNSDGNQDLAVATLSGLQVLLGNGNGTFQSPTLFTGQTANAFLWVGIADLNHDGKPDVIASGTLFGNNGVQLFLNDGTGNFTTGGAYGLGGTNLAPFIAQDFNGDGNLDIVMASFCAENSAGPCSDGTVSVLLGNGDGSMQGASMLAPNTFNQSNSIITADVNGDGIPDLIQAVFSFDQSNAQGGVAVTLGTGNGTYAAPVLYPTGAPETYWVAAGDFNGDGKLDLAVADVCSDDNCTQGGISILLGNGDGTFQTPAVYGSGAPYALTLVTGDFNGDGKLDVAAMNQDAPPSIGILLGNGDGTLQPSVVTTTSAGVSSNYSIAAGDLNGDGKTDLALLSLSTDQTTGLISVYLSGAGGVLTQTGAAFSSGGTAYGAGIGFNGMSIAIGDVNHDGKPDIVVANGCQLGDSGCAYGSLASFVGAGDGTFSSGTVLTVPDGNFLSLLLSDVNGDGNLDAVAMNLTGVAVFTGRGDGSFQSPTVYAGVSTGIENQTLTLSDLNIVQPGTSNDLLALIVSRAGSYLVTTSNVKSIPSGEQVQLSSTISASYLLSLTPGGSISYFDGKSLLGSVALTGGTAAHFAFAPLGQGVHSITAQYSGDSNFTAHVGLPLLLVVTPPVLTSIMVTPANPSIVQGATDQFAATGTYSDGSTKNITSSVTWSSASSTVATISSAGLATATGAGTSSIKATDGAISGSTTLTVTLPPISLSPASIVFGNKTVGTATTTPVTLTNNSTAAIAISSIAITPKGTVSYTETNNCGTSIAASATCTIQVTFDPQSTGAKDDFVTVTDGAGMQTVTLTGTGVTSPVTLNPSSIAFGSKTVGTTTTTPVTLTNNSTAAISISSIAITPKGTVSYTETNNCGSSIAASATCTIQVTFDPQSTGTKDDFVTVTDGAGTQTVTLTGTGLASPIVLNPSSIAFGSKTVGTATTTPVTVTNNSTAAIAITSIAITPKGTVSYTETNNCGSSIAASATCTIQVTFDPQSTGTKDDFVTVIDGAGTQTVTLTGTGLASPIALNPSSIAFGSKTVGTSTTTPVTVTNNSTAAIAISSIAITPKGTVSYTVTNDCGPSIAASATCTIQVTFDPKSTGAKDDFVTVTDGAGTQTVTLTGTGAN